MKERIKFIRKDKNLTQEEFALKVDLTKNYISLVENGNRTLADRTISDICRIFSVNEEWLRTGGGEPYKKMTKNQEIQEFANTIMENLEDSFKKRFILALSKLNESDWEVLKKIAEELKED